MIREALEAYANATQTKFKHDRTQTVGASEVGQCIRKTAFVKRQPPARRGAPRVGSWGASTRGKVIEDHFWYPALKKKYGSRLLMAGPRGQETLIRKPLSATPDGLLVDMERDCLSHLGVPDIGPSRCISVECKTIDPRVNLREAKQENIFQVHVGLGLIRELKEYKPDYSLISYTDASFFDEVTEFVVRFDPQVFEAAEARAKAVFRDDPLDHRPEGYISGGSECDYCPFVGPCGVARRSVPVLDLEADPQFAAEITDMVRELVEVKTRKKADEMTIKLMEDDIKTRMREKKIRRIPGVVTWSSVKGRSSYDNKAIKAKLESLGASIEEFETVGDPTDRLQVLI